MRRIEQQEALNQGLIEGVIIASLDKESAIETLRGLDFNIQEEKNEINSLWEHYHE